ncbi:MAG: hypothetical protein CBD21_00975 [bacterium TMED161]|nr:sodium:solute symporter [Candidatus Neomarinimicrobiota bacterium]OUW21503.1 MAG: hypothetical protein CBD21_00975 [bacterium TMED161]
MLDLIIIIIFFLFFIGIGFYFSQSNLNSKDYYTASGSIPWPVAMFSIVATETSVLTFISIPSLSYRSDWWFLQLAIGYIIGRVLVSAFLLPKYFSNNIVSIYEVIGNYFGRPVQKLSSIIFLVTRLFADGIRFLATAIIFNILTGWGIVPSVFLIGLITLIYSYLGGIRSILWIDSIQFFVYLFGGIISIYYISQNLPSGAILKTFGNSINTVFHFEGSILRDSNLLINGIIGGTFLSFASHGADYMMVQRSLSCSNLSAARKAMIGSGIFVFIQFSIFLLLGSLLTEYFKMQNFESLGVSLDYVDSNWNVLKDREFPLFINYFLNPGIRGILLVGVLSAAMSTISSSINSLSSSTVRDLLNVKDDIKLSKTISIFWAFALIFIASFFDESNNLLLITGLRIASFTYGILLSLFLLSLLKIKPKDIYILFGSICGIISVFIMQSNDISWTWFILVSTFVTMTISISLSLIFDHKR